MSVPEVAFRPTLNICNPYNSVSYKKKSLVCCCCRLFSSPLSPAMPCLIVRSLHNSNVLLLITQHTTNIGSLTIPPSKTWNFSFFLIFFFLDLLLYPLITQSLFQYPISEPFLNVDYSVCSIFTLLPTSNPNPPNLSHLKKKKKVEKKKRNHTS